ncbi:NAD(P)-binding protein [Tuber magnatum]|uniref:NAD(P)-binding protein n=1 Tax=Tuber magnatum TaxID=42249 RepID=A0A317T354_9PEZI|nr:NAD(P)-binding protein [Tuber magnatum]
MAPKIFATGASGYIGGTALDVIIKAHPEYEITALVRNPEKGTAVTKKYPDVRIISGDLDSGPLIEEESSKADIVLHFADCDHVSSAKSIAAGLGKRTEPSYLIHTSGAAILPDINRVSEFGKAASDKIYDDIDNVQEITSLPESGHIHRDVDSIVIGANSNTLKTAIVCPPTIYGPGSGSGNVRSNQVPELTKHTLKRGQAFQVTNGATIWNNVHVQDLANLYLLLTEAAAEPGGGKATWGPEGYYFAENGEHSWGEIAKKIAKKAKTKGYLKTDEVISLPTEEVIKHHPFGHILWGTNSRGWASRARNILGWEPKGAPLDETLDDVIESEAKALGL